MALVGGFVALVFLYSLVSRRLERTPLTAPVLFTAAGLLIPALLPELRSRQADPKLFLQIAEVGLVMLLFTDASRVDLRLLRGMRSLPLRLLSTGMLLTILLGGLAALVVFRQLSVWEAGILAAILAPTDAGLGQVIVSSARVPQRIRQALNVEAGLNDGLSVPFLLFFMARAGAGAEGGGAGLARFLAEQLGGGILIGLAVGFVGGWLLERAQRASWMAESARQLGVVALPLACILASEAAGASMFIAAFVAGLATQLRFGEVGRHAAEFAEQWGQLLNYSVFFLFGILVGREWHGFHPALLLYAALSLTVVRLLPVALALAGTGLDRASVLFMGWFGPRGLASIVLGLVYLESVTHQGGEPIIRQAVMVTVLLSVFAHGLSAYPGIGLYARSGAAPDPSPVEGR